MPRDLRLRIPHKNATMVTEIDDYMVLGDAVHLTLQQVILTPKGADITTQPVKPVLSSIQYILWIHMSRSESLRALVQLNNGMVGYLRIKTTNIFDTAYWGPKNARIILSESREPLIRSMGRRTYKLYMKTTSVCDASYTLN